MNHLPVKGCCFARWLVLIGLILCGTLSFDATVFAQVDYTPDDPEVEQMVQKAVAALGNMGGDIGQRTLAALAIVQAGKRYQEEIPKDHPLVQHTIAGILGLFPPDESYDRTNSSDSNILAYREVYFPCLALILLAEVDDVKYQPQIQRLINMLVERQRPFGAFTYLSNVQLKTGDTSQTQYAALALYVAKQHRFNYDPDVASRALQWLVENQQDGGYWVYKVRHRDQYGPGVSIGGEATLSIQAAGLGTAYLLSDLLQLQKRKKSLTVAVAPQEYGLPKSVTVYVKPRGGEDQLLQKEGPLVSFDLGGLNTAYRSGDDWLENNFSISPNRWDFYYLYALERYAWFREQAEGDLGKGKLSTWYDQGVEFLKHNQQDSGRFQNPKFSAEVPTVATAFAVLFLVRSSEIISLPVSDSQLIGGKGFPKDAELRTSRGEIQTSEVDKNLADIVDLMREDVSQEQLARLTKSLKKAIVEFKRQDDKSRGEIKSFLRTMLSARNFYRRLIAVRFLAGEQDMDNVPGLVYALGDPDFRVCLEAHDGLRLISRRIDSLEISELARNGSPEPGILSPADRTSIRLEYNDMKRQWTEWFLKIRPDAELLD
jgi:hypothetical protein